MDRARFAALLAEDGYEGPLDRRMEAGQAVPEHRHPFDARLPVLEGEFILGQAGETRRYGPGEMFEVPAGAKHAESFGPTGATCLVGRRSG